MTQHSGPPDRWRDLDTPSEVGEFVTRFYREIAQDDRFHHYFETVAHVDWHVHTLELTEYWSGILFDGPHDNADRVIEQHRWLHETTPFDNSLFERWLEIFNETLDGGWRGVYAERLRKRAKGLAWAMAHRLVPSER
jgi:hemoglobin